MKGFIELTSRKKSVPGRTLINVNHITEVHEEKYEDDSVYAGITIMGTGNIPVKESYDEVKDLMERSFL